MGRRREARELALRCLHQWDLRGPDEGEELADFVLNARVSPDAEAYARRLLREFWDHRREVDEHIAQVAAHWSLDRLAVVDRNVLRLAATEIYYFDDVPPHVSIDEAIELAKSYSTEKSGAFVNGILDTLAAEWEKSRGPR